MTRIHTVSSSFLSFHSPIQKLPLQIPILSPFQKQKKIPLLSLTYSMTSLPSLPGTSLYKKRGSSITVSVSLYSFSDSVVPALQWPSKCAMLQDSKREAVSGTAMLTPISQHNGTTM